jgi:hypothetical protein
VGAQDPTPTLFKAPNTKRRTQAMPSLTPERPVASPPKGIILNFPAKINTEVKTNPTPIKVLIVSAGNFTAKRGQI